jgi:hypothetical protein
MAIIEGWDGAIRLDSATGDVLTQMTNWKINFAQELQDVTNFGTTTPDRSFLYTLRSHTVEFSGYLENGSTGQYQLIKKMLKSGTPSATTMLFFTNKTTGAKAGFRGAIFIESIGIDSPVDNLVTFSGSGRASAGLSTFSS